MNITQILFEQVARQPEALAIRHASGDLSYREFGDRVAGVAAGLVHAGVQAKEVVAIRLDDPLAHWTATLALAHMGATVVSIPRSMPDAQRERLLRLTGCCRVLLGDEYPTTVETTVFSETRWSSIVITLDGTNREPAVVDPDQPWIYVSGSGSTGRPKIMPITHGQELARRAATITSLPYASDDVLHSMVGMHFSTAKHRALEAFSVGAAVSLVRPGVVDLRREVDQGVITVMHGSVFHIEELLNRIPSNAELEYRKLKALMLAGSTMSMSLRNKIRHRLTPKLVIRWGANESGAATTTRDESVFSVKGSVGYPLPNARIEVVNRNGVILPPGVDGLIRVSSPTVIAGYLGDPEATQRVFRDGWFYPGDIGHLTADGQLVHRGRADDMMIVSGVNVYPAEIEECLRGYPGVQDVLATPLRHPQVQDLPVALVVCAAGVPLDAQDVIEHVRNLIGRHTLHDLVFVDRIPRNEQGKVQREDVAKILQAKWGTRKNGAALSATGSGGKTPRLVGEVTLGFKLPPDSRPEALTAWIVLLDGELLSLPASHQVHGVASEGERWLRQVMTLALGLLHALRAPFFDPVEIIQCHRAEGLNNPWRAICRSPDPALVPLPVWEGVIKVAFKLAAWAAKADPDSDADRQHFFKVIEANVIRGFAKFKPSGKSTFEVLRVAHRTGVPYLALPGGMFQLGWGANARRIDRSTTDRDSTMGMRWTQNKLLSAQLLRQAGLPAPTHFKVDTLEQARGAAQRLGYPVVVKPADLERGEGVYVDVKADTLESAFQEAHKRSPRKLVLVEQQVPGVCHRLFIAAGKLLYAVRRLPIGLYADGRSTIRALVEAECKAQQQLPPWKRSGLRPLDDLALQMLRRQAWNPDDVPPAGKFVALRRIETTAWGGVDEEVTHTIHPDNVSAATAAAQVFGLEVAGVDLISRDVQQPWHVNGAVINEVNFAPLLGGGEVSRRYIAEYLDRIVPNQGRIPVHVFPGNEEAWAEARLCWDRLLANGVNAYLTNGQTTWDGKRAACLLEAATLERRVQALLMRKDVQALVVAAPSLTFLGQDFMAKAAALQAIDKSGQALEPSVRLQAP